MTEDRSPSKSSPGSGTAAATAGKQRKKRKWDQPAENLLPVLTAVPGIQLGMSGIVGVTSLPGMLYPLSAALLANTNTPTYISAPQSATAPPATAIQKLNQSKIQGEMIAREIIINDAEDSVRYKLTKKQTQEEIQKSTGAVVITRGKYLPPNGLPDGERPLYLHISASANLKDTAERLKAVDRAASMVEEILKQGQHLLSQTSNGQVNTCVFLGFDANPSLNIAARIRGPNDQYINHIMNETGATVVLRGQDSGCHDASDTGDSHEPLHLFLSSMNTKSLEAAKMLAENLMDTIAAECGASRVSSSKVYGAVPPQLLLGEVKSSSVDSSSIALLPRTNSSAAASLISVPNAFPVSVGFTGYPSTSGSQNMVKSYSDNLTNANYVAPTTGGTYYNGYGGIYPQATVIQQVASALKQASSISSVPSTNHSTNTTQKSSLGLNVAADKNPTQRRKFQELLVPSAGVLGHQNSRQESEFLKSGLADSGSTEISKMPTPRKLIPAEMPPPPPKLVPSEAPIKLESLSPKEPTSNLPSKSQPKKSQVEISKKQQGPDAQLRLVEYDGEDDDDDDDKE